MTVTGKKLSVDIQALARRATGQGLRFDKVATRLIGRLKAAAAETVPGGMTVLLTITAPIRLPSKTTDSLECKIRTLVTRGSLGHDEEDKIHGNDVVIRLLRHESEQAPKMIGFVHNFDSDPLLLLNVSSELLEFISAEAGTGSWLEAYQDMSSQLRVVKDFQKILMAFDEARL